MKHTLKLFFLILSLTTIGYLLLAHPHSTSAVTSDRSVIIEGANPAQPVNIDKFSAENIPSISTFLGCSITPCFYADDSPVYEQTALTTVNRVIASLVTDPPVETSEWIAYQLENFGFAPPAYAQGIGFSSLTPVLQIWKAFRNMAYFLFVIVFVVIGFMIMFRAQIDPQTVVTVQSALPKIILTLILITFSYAIAGFVVDLIYFSIYTVTALFDTFGIIADPDLTRQILFNKSIFRIGMAYFINPFEAGPATAATNAISAVIQGTLGFPRILDIIVDSLAYLIVSIFILVQLLRVLVQLIMAYIGIILSVIFAPLQLMLNAFPGSQSFTSWLRSLVANAAVFPAVAIMIIIGAYLMGGVDVDDLGLNLIGGQRAGFGTEEASGFIPPMIISRAGLITDPGQTVGVEHISAIIGFGIIMLLPEVAKTIKEALGSKEGFGGQAMSPISAPLAAAGGLLAGGFLSEGGRRIAQKGIGIPGFMNISRKIRNFRTRTKTQEDLVVPPGEEIPDDMRGIGS